MAVPKRKTSKTRRDKRRTHDALQFNAAVERCPDCGEWKERHHVCMSCGTYRGKQVFEVQEV
ncbi:MAG: 50S ribosomal protein L32 [Deltaproteobacteria bacterium]|nr:50S ribosomal protein L32 [Deltaproteobacteria bacterium]